MEQLVVDEKFQKLRRFIVLAGCMMISQYWTREPYRQLASAVVLWPFSSAGIHIVDIVANFNL
jgi:hypothetical protein